MITAAGVADTLRLLIPGFVALEAFYRIGPRSKRSDLQRTLWSILISAPVGAASSVVGVRDANAQLAVGVGIALAGGALAGWLWARAASHWVRLQAGTDIRAWDTVLTRSDWIQVWTKGGRSFTGHPQFVANSAETDDLDFYLEDPTEVFEDGDVDQLPGLEGFLVARADIQYLAVLKPATDVALGGPQAAPG